MASQRLEPKTIGEQWIPGGRTENIQGTLPASREVCCCHMPVFHLVVPVGPSIG